MATQSMQALKPNVVFILVDDVSWGDFSVSGGQQSTQDRGSTCGEGQIKAVAPEKTVSAQSMI